MTKRHFEAAAEIIRTLRAAATNRAQGAQAIAAQEAFIALFRQFNPQFDEARFAAACALPPKGKG